MKRLIAFTILLCMLLLPACADESAVQEPETETETTTESVQPESYPEAESWEVPPNAEESLVPSQDEIDEAMMHDAQEAYDEYMMEMMEQEDSQYPPYF